MTQYTILMNPVPAGRDGTHGWEDIGDEIYLDLDPSYSDKVDFSFKSIFQIEIVQLDEWLRVAKNVARYNKEMYRNWVEYFHILLHHKFVDVMAYCNPEDYATLASIYRLVNSTTLEDLLSGCELFVKVTKNKNLHKSIKDLQNCIRTILA